MGFQKKKKIEYVIKCQMLSIFCMFWQIFLNIFEVNACAQLLGLLDRNVFVNYGRHFLLNTGLAKSVKRSRANIHQ